jgi:GNAT superfamily N-acetyltransferase
MMSGVAEYSAVERLPAGRRIQIRALRISDRNALLAAAANISDQSLYRRFFGVRRNFSDAEISAFLDVDFVQQVALVALTADGGAEAVTGGARYIIVRPGVAEVAFMVVDKFQGQGIGSLLMRHLATLARTAGLTELLAEVMPENAAMLKIFERSGLRLEMRREQTVMHVTLHLRP